MKYTMLKSLVVAIVCICDASAQDSSRGSVPLAMHDTAGFELPELNSSRHDRLLIFGTIPAHVEVELKAVWEATAESDQCMHTVAAAGGPIKFLRRESVPVQMVSSTGRERVWQTSRDHFLPGACGWKLREIIVFADRLDSGQSVNRRSNIQNRVAYVCRPTDKCDENNWAINDDNLKPVYRYCKFSVIRSLPAGSASNPCVFDWDKHRGKDSGKSEHHLRSDQTDVRFVIVDLEEPR